MLTIMSTNAWAATNVASPKSRVVVLDAGHGGASRPGAVVNGIMEKDLNLAVTLEVKRLLQKKMPALEVYLTRESDKQLHQSKESDNLTRPRLANSKEADLFVAIHANALDNKDVAGAEVIVLSLDGATQGHTQKRTTARDNEDYTHIDNIDKNSLAYIEAISMLMNNDPINRTFGQIVGAKFKGIGRKFRGVKIYPEKVWTVLYPLRGPGVIIEMGFMTNAAELKYMASSEGQRQMAEAIADAIVEYMKRLDQMTVSGSSTTESTVLESTPAEKSSPTKSEATSQGYTIQVMASATHLECSASRFGSLASKIEEFEGKGTYKYKYCYGRFATLAEARTALSKVQESFKDAYIVQFVGNTLK